MSKQYFRKNILEKLWIMMRIFRCLMSECLWFIFLSFYAFNSQYLWIWAFETAAITNKSKSLKSLIFFIAIIVIEKTVNIAFASLVNTSEILSNTSRSLLARNGNSRLFSLARALTWFTTHCREAQTKRSLIVHNFNFQLILFCTSWFSTLKGSLNQT